MFEAVRRMRPGVSVMCLHGAMQQMKRVAVYEAFKNKQFVVLFATDIAARGLGMLFFLCLHRVNVLL